MATFKKFEEIESWKMARELTKQVYKVYGAFSGWLRKNKYDPLNHTKPHEMDASICVTSCDFVDRFAASFARTSVH